MERVNQAIRSPEPKKIALSTTLAKHKPRIFEQGLDDKGAKIGTYSTKPISISFRNQARNTGQTYFKGGYAEYKSKVGKNPGYVNLRNTDQMYADYGMLQNGDEFAFGFHNEINADKSGWMETKYQKDIFSLSDDELNVFVNTLVDEQSKRY